MRFIRLIAVAWAFPWTLFGCVVGLIGPLTGGGVRYRQGVIEFYGGLLHKALMRLPVGPVAMTLGHVVLGRTTQDLDRVRDHELVHVRQYERWGPLFVPAYLLCSMLLWLRGKDFYRENPFEKEAYDKAP